VLLQTPTQYKEGSQHKEITKKEKKTLGSVLKTMASQKDALTCSTGIKQHALLPVEID